METEKILLDVQFDQNVVQQAISSIQTYRGQIDVLKESQKQLEAQGLKNSEQYVKQESAIKALSTEVKQNQRIVDANAMAQKKTQGYIEQLKKSIQQLTVQYDNLSKEELENVNIGGKLEKTLKAQNDELRRLKGNAGDTRLEVGRYKEGIIEASKQIDIAGVNVGNTLKDITEINEKFFGTMAQGFKEMGIQAKLFGTAARTALTVTGIGLLIGALGTMIAYWDDIKVAIGLADTASERYFKKQIADLDVANAKLEQRRKELEAINEILGIEGGKENEIFANRRKILEEDIALEENKRKQIAKRIIEYQKENGLTAENLKLREKIQKSTGIEDPFIQQIGEYKRLFDASTLRLVDLRSQLTKLQTEVEKFEGKELPGFQFIVPESDAEATARAREKEISDSILNFQINLQDRKIELEQEYSKKSVDMTLMTELERQQILQEYSDLNAEIVRVENEMILAAVADTSAAMQGIFDRETAAHKAFGLTSIAIDTGVAISKGVATAQNAPYPGNVIATFQTIAMVLANIARAKSLLNFAMGGIIEPVAKFASGGFIPGYRKSFLLGGNPHSSGGTKFVGSDGTRFEAERNEALVVVNKRDTPMLRTLNSVNSIHGRNFLADGGIALRNSRSQVEQIYQSTRIGSDIRKELRQIKIYTQVTEFNRVNNRVLKNQITSELR